MWFKRNGSSVCSGKGQTVHPKGRNIKRVSSKAPPEITAPCILFASVRETKYTLSNIPKPVGNLCETNLGNDLITASKWNQPCLEIVCCRSCRGRVSMANRLRRRRRQKSPTNHPLWTKRATNFLQMHQSNSFKKPNCGRETSVS